MEKFKGGTDFKSLIKEWVRKLNFNFDHTLGKDVQTSIAKTSTGANYGGVLSINGGDASKFDISAGSFTFVDAYTDPPNTTYNEVILKTQTALTVTNIATQPATYIWLNSDGTITQSALRLTGEDSRDIVELGVLLHLNLTTINSASQGAILNYDVSQSLRDFNEAFGYGIVTSGNKVTANGANLKLDFTGGTTFGLGSNYGNNNKYPNVITSAGDTEIVFFTTYRNASPLITPVTEVPTDQYDPNGDGSLVDVPDGFYTVHRVLLEPPSGLLLLQYGQYIYDSLKKAVQSFDKDSFEEIAIISALPLINCIAVEADATDLTDFDSAKFIDIGSMGEQSFSRIETYAKFGEPVELIDGLSYQRQDITLVLDTGVIYADVEVIGGGDLIYVFGQREYILDCTGGSGVDGKARIALTDRTATNPLLNYVYVIKSGEDAILQQSTSLPTGEFAYIGKFLLPDTATFDTDGAYSSQRFTDAKEFDGRSSVQRTNERLRVLNAEYESGIVQTVSVTTNVGTPDAVDFDTTSGEAWQKHIQDFPAFDVSTDGLYVVNHPTTKYLKVTDLADLLVDANNDSLSGKRFNFVIWGCISKSTGECKLFLNLPLGSYGNDADVVADPDQTSVTSIPKDFRGTGFLIGRLALRHTVVSGGTWTNIASSELGTQTIDLRGHPVGSFGGSVSIPASSTFDDGSFIVFNNADNTKLLDLDISNVGIGTTKTITMANANIDLADVVLNNTHRGSNGTDHSHIDQDVTNGSSPTFDGNNFTGVDAADVDIADGGGLITATDVEGALQEHRGLINTNTGKVTNATHTGDVTGATELTIGADKVHDSMIDWGTGAGQVSAADIVIADAGNKITGTEVETALQENRTAIDLNTAHKGGDGSDHADVATNTADLVILNTNYDTNLWLHIRNGRRIA